MPNNYYVLSDDTVKTQVSVSEEDDVVYSYVEPTEYELSNNRLIVANEIGGQWELLKQEGNHYVSERVSHDMNEIKEYL